ncbi:hypothetical protein [Chondromyces apiculatus]|uniref:hypothetical protein n=1 Tax=Chondromyces apiculatus TaxID=51 RepID=UPI0018CC6CFF|nr:hypothetical protein [Chondromyces apiculatus]
MRFIPQLPVLLSGCGAISGLDDFTLVSGDGGGGAGGREGVEPCPQELATCSHACVNLGIDPENCGECGIVCAAGETCASGSCTCHEDRAYCGGRCTDTSTDASNCGMCGRDCLGQACEVSFCAPLILSSDLVGPYGLSLYEATVYVVDQDAGTVLQVPTEGGTPIVLATGQQEPSSIVADDASLYWTNLQGAGRDASLYLNDASVNAYASSDPALKQRLYPVYYNAMSQGLWNVPTSAYLTMNNGQINHCTALPDGTSNLGLCVAGCFPPDAHVTFSSGDITIKEAHDSGRSDLVTLGPEATLDAPDYITNQVASRRSSRACPR